MDVEATTAIRQAEVTAAKRMIDRTKNALISTRRGSPATAAMVGRDARLAPPREGDLAGRPGVRESRRAGWHLLG